MGDYDSMNASGTPSGTIESSISERMRGTMALRFGTLDWLAIAFILTAATVVRFWKLGLIPTVFFHDECDNTFNAIEILQNKGPGIYDLDWKPQPALAVNIIALSLRLLGPGAFAIRMPSALISLLGLLAFFAVSRRVAGRLAATLGTLLLAFHPGYLHYSRAGWENVQICLYALLAIDAIDRAEAGKGLWWWGIAGALAAVGSLVYFGGRTIIVALIMYIPIALLYPRRPLRDVVIGVGLMLAAIILVLSPSIPTLYHHWDDFNRRTQAVLITHELPEGSSSAALVRKVAANAWRSARFPFDGSVSQQPRYFLPGRPLFSWPANVALVVGLVSSVIGCFRRTVIWWIALAVTFVLTQALTSGTPHLARGIAMLPIGFLFMTLGIDAIIRMLGARRGVASVILSGLALGMAFADARAYFRWAQSQELAQALQPAVELRDFQDWWRFQNRWVAQNRGFFNVGMWLERKAGRAFADDPNPDSKVRHEGAGAQRMRAPLEELSVHLHSSSSDWREQSGRSKPWEKENEGSSSKVAGGNTSES